MASHEYDVSDVSGLDGPVASCIELGRSFPAIVFFRVMRSERWL
jgi:hypothetical protein